MIDFGKASKAEANFRIALYKGGQSGWELVGLKTATRVAQRETVVVRTGC